TLSASVVGEAGLSADPTCDGREAEQALTPNSASATIAPSVTRDLILPPTMRNGVLRILTGGSTAASRLPLDSTGSLWPPLGGPMKNWCIRRVVISVTDTCELARLAGITG